MHWDKLAEKKSQSLYAAWLNYLLQQSPAFKHSSWFSSNQSFRTVSMLLLDFPSWAEAASAMKKSSDETSVMVFVARFTSIPIPTILGVGKCSGSPYIITTVIDGTLLSKRLQDPSVLEPSLNPDASESDLKTAYSGIARIVLELSKPVFKYIGGLKYDSRVWRVAKRPLTLKMNELIRVRNIHPNEFVDYNHTFESASKYFQQLAE
ncbi:hypothetical protein ACJ73_08031 [Blastomyces percursus]|uniref:Aminoglycoside phosphotransferase domain-containing protein n=1 Tax=Blastomyces percursus TaxID=1658174 RepID=A0A1J9QKA7_9EURO|nr:hypothetical protein ACJ73_08031 [Blastomyces percursus]